jgi:hypothetical protein
LIAALSGSETEEGSIWIPQFKVDSGLICNIEAAKQLNDLAAERPCSVDDSLTQVINRNLLELSIDIDKDSLKLKEHESDAVIRGEFVVGLISKDLLSDFKIPLFMTLITKAHYIDV